MNRVPIRRINFTTPPDRRAALFEETKALYSEFLGAPESEDSDGINRMDRINASANPVNPVHPVQNGTSSGTAPDGNKVLEFVSARLSAAPEESDVAHDLLAYLAERMIEMNKEKNGEIKGFLGWLEGEIGAPVSDLTNKTALKEYYNHDFQNPDKKTPSLIGILEKNKKKLGNGYDPKIPANYKHLQQWYDDSKGRIAPLIGKIEATDGLIDAIVYKLYGLTDDEIKIVEESISGNKDLNTKEDTKL